MFETKHAEVRKKLYEALRNTEYGVSFTYERLSEIMGVDSVLHRPIITAISRKLEKYDNRTLRNDFGLGYSIANPSEHIDLAKSKHRQAKNKLNKATYIIAATDRTKLQPDERKRIDNIEINLRAQKDAIRHLENRTVAVEAKQQGLEENAKGLESKMEAIMARIENLEKREAS